jgi:hypothetical protein
MIVIEILLGVVLALVGILWIERGWRQQQRENLARELRTIAGIRAWTAAPHQVRLTAKPMPTFLKSRKVWPLDPLRCQHGHPLYSCGKPECTAMLERYRLAMPDDA